ncbi:hypothetical protein [Williamsia sp. DF01-3]|nr:hypothetical protein [Williamsia sp. DF01-3]MCK0515645.1 hypothetical protein [Williamsia sp. DF01-3]
MDYSDANHHGKQAPEPAGALEKRLLLVGVAGLSVIALIVVWVAVS